ncbi:MAG: NAD(+) diphosphatase [Microbacterium sp.]|uniref:NAD(+) diphosphatase n=1 Tax=Microbacterium sp. TaxID=51671 RepID=UPI0039E3E437
MSAQPPPLARALIDRAAGERLRAGLLDDARADPAARVLVVRGDEAPLADPSRDATALQFAAVSEIPDGAVWAFLGRDGAGPVLCAAFAAGAPDPVAAPGGWAGLREVGGDLDDADAGVFVEALSLARWLIEAPHCPACGALAEVETAGWSRRCTACGREHFPRTDPAVIVAVESEDGERLLLGSNALWGQDRYSCFAGFVEAGESLEAAVAREVEEESGIRVASSSYRGSQAWPYPRSLMLGFRARAVADRDARADGEEIVQVRWFERAEIRVAFAGGSDVTLPGSASIAHALIREWAEERE